MKKVISKVMLLAAALMLSTAVMAQDSYRKTLEQFMYAYNGEQYSKTKMVEGFSQIGIQQGLSKESAEDAAAKFYDEKFNPQLMSIMEKSYKKYLSEADLKELTKAYSTPEGKLATEHMLSSAQSEASQKKLIGLLMGGLMSILQGQDAAPIPAPDCSDSYKKLSESYFKAMNSESIIESVMTTIKGQLGGKPEATQFLDKLTTYMSNNTINLLLNLFYPTVTEADMTYISKVMSTQAGQNLTSAAKDGMSEIVTFATNSTKEFMQSLQK